MKPTAYKTLEDSVERVNGYIGAVLLRDIDSDMVRQMIYDLSKKGYSESVMNKAKMAAAKHYLDVVPVFDITIPTAKNQDAEKLAKNNWMRDDEIRTYEEACKKTYVPKKYTKYAGKELLVHMICTPKVSNFWSAYQMGRIFHSTRSENIVTVNHCQELPSNLLPG